MDIKSLEIVKIFVCEKQNRNKATQRENRLFY